MHYDVLRFLKQHPHQQETWAYSIHLVQKLSRVSIVIEKVIGQGAFGQLAKGTASQLRGVEGTTTVAIKMLKGKV